jgi:hypothetical protein
MLGFKKSITPDELGQAVLSYANDRLVADAYRSLGQRFEGHDASKGWAAVLQANGLSGPTVKLYRMFYTHAALQTHFRSFAAAREIMRGAMANFTIRPAAYDFGKIFDDLEAVFEGRYEFDAGVVPLCDPADQPMSAVLAAKYLVNDFVFPNLPNRQRFVDEFADFSATLCSSAATVRRAADLISGKFTIIGQSGQP